MLAQLREVIQSLVLPKPCLKKMDNCVLEWKKKNLDRNEQGSKVLTAESSVMWEVPDSNQRPPPCQDGTLNQLS